MDSPIIALYSNSQDFLELLAKKHKQAQVNAAIAQEAAVLQTFYDLVHNILIQSSLDMQECKLLSVNEHVKAKILEGELKATYNAIYQAGHATLFTDLSRKTVIPSRGDLNVDVQLKNNVNNVRT